LAKCCSAAAKPSSQTSIPALPGISSRVFNAISPDEKIRASLVPGQPGTENPSDGHLDLALPESGGRNRSKSQQAKTLDRGQLEHQAFPQIASACPLLGSGLHVEGLFLVWVRLNTRWPVPLQLGHNRPDRAGLQLE